MESSCRALNSGLTSDSRRLAPTANPQKHEIREVWCYNLDKEMNQIMIAATKYPVIGMDTEFPGICFCSKDLQRKLSDYSIIRENVNQLKLIQLGITFCTSDGKVAEDVPSWQFNFRFSLTEDVCNSESIDLLQKAGINFDAHAKNGVNPRRFGELFTMSGLVLSPSMTWVVFHGVYDFAYLLHILTGCDLPETQKEFLSILRVYFPHFYDVKMMLTMCPEYTGGLNHVAELLHVTRDGTAHQSGSDSKVTVETFFRLRTLGFQDNSDAKFDGVLFETNAAGM
ncbi:uncharacterized protein [Blastocystis hominis]|uniref:poly(A)-specific ribonuclease n=1 Tax=Blastocystis hominis TaxID=12968 RepID=D8M1U6_BLAHO|nr:uncharacterized protein [Blastocystis hominis]CBK22035.2 unnamed protein product [Blastocystis hominis]|eukprot:XP_012896083.1 uncharacterized protein [Blastocystis hominis]